MPAAASDIRGVRRAFAVGAAIFATLFCGAVAARVGALFVVVISHDFFSCPFDSGASGLCHSKMHEN
jgi:hypothetical protein